MQTINVTVWNEYVHERSSERIAKVYPDGIHGAIAQMLGRSCSCQYPLRKFTGLLLADHGRNKQ